MRRRVEKIQQYRRMVYTGNLLDQVDTNEEHWEMVGDFSNYRHAETASLYRRMPLVSSDQDVLWAEESKIDYINGNGVDLFGNKTQGYPYHLAVLAVGILFESRFPNHVYVFGDIDRSQVEHTILWMNSVLSSPVTLPICLDGPRLLTRLKSAYQPAETLAIERFSTLFWGTNEEKLATLLQHADRTLVLQKWRQDLASYSSLSQFGAIDLLSQFLTVTQNLRQLIELVEAARQEPKQFPLEELLKVLCQKFITIDKPERKPLFMFTSSSEHLSTIEDTFGQVFMRLAGAPSFTDFYLLREELLEIFCHYAPQQRKTFQDLITDGEKKCREELEQTKTLLATLEEKAKTVDPGPPCLSVPTGFQEVVGPDSNQSAAPAPEEEYILDQVVSQTRTFHSSKEEIKQIGLQLQTLIKKHAEVFASTDRQYYLYGIYQASSQQGFGLRESAWQVIDQEDNLDILRSLLALTSVNEQAQDFWQWRIYVLEHPALWPYLIGVETQLPRFHTLPSSPELRRK